LVGFVAAGGRSGVSLFDDALEVGADDPHPPPDPDSGKGALIDPLSGLRFYADRAHERCVARPDVALRGSHNQVDLNGGAAKHGVRNRAVTGQPSTGEGFSY
jgi:hypothetical protein